MRDKFLYYVGILSHAIFILNMGKVLDVKQQLPFMCNCIHLSVGAAAGQFTAAPPTCPGDTFTFRCTVTGDINGVTTWRVAGSIECNLAHRATSIAVCDMFTASPETGFGTSGSSFTSILSGTAAPALNGTLVECFGPANNVEPGNRVDGSILQIIGQYVFM